MPSALLAAAAAIAVEPSAAAAIEACTAQSIATQRACEGEWRGIRLQIDRALRGSLRVPGGATWTSDCPYDVVHRSGGCALVAKGVMFVQPYRSDIPAIVWGDRNAERRERTIRFDGSQSASWTDDISAEDTRRTLALLEQSRRATFAWRPAHAKVMSMTTINFAGFADLRLLLTAMTQAAARACRRQIGWTSRPHRARRAASFLREGSVRDSGCGFPT